MILNKLFKRLSAKNALSDSDLDYDKLPILTAEELIRFTGQQNRIRSIKRIIKIDDRHFQVLYLDVIHRFAELVQLMPASQAHHHAVPGGLFIHTLEVIEQAMILRQQYKLPAFVEQEVQERERHAWTYAVFTAAILHDIGKRLSMCVFIRDDGQVHSAFETPLAQTACRHYKLLFQDPKYYVLHEVLGLALIDILPPIGKTFLFKHLNIVKEMLAYIHGDKHQSGMIGEIIRQADQQSTGRSLAHTASRKFKGASLENLGERLMTQLRQLIASNHFVINQANANIYVSKDGYAYCVAKVIVDGIRNAMNQQGEDDIPSDNNRIFDTLQEYGFAETNAKNGKSIHTICLYHNGSTRTFTVLKFATRKLFRTEPTPFEGVIEEVANKAAVKTSTATPPVTETTNTTNEATSNASTEAIPELPISNNNDLLGELLNLPELSGSDNEATPTASDNDKAQTPQQNQANSPQATAENTPENTTKVSQNNLAYQFLAWCRAKVKDKTIVINESNGMIQKVNHKGSPVIAVVTPRIFYEYAAEIGLNNPKDKRSFAKIQSAIHKEKLNIVNATGQIHIYKIKKSLNNPMNGNIKIRHYLFEVEKFADGDTEFAAIIDKIGVNGNLVGG